MAWVTLGKFLPSGPWFSNRKKVGWTGSIVEWMPGKLSAHWLLRCHSRLDHSPTFQPSQHLHLCWRRLLLSGQGQGGEQAMLAARHLGTHFPRAGDPGGNHCAFPQCLASECRAREDPAARS